MKDYLITIIRINGHKSIHRWQANDIHGIFKRIDKWQNGLELKLYPIYSIKITELPPIQ